MFASVRCAKVYEKANKYKFILLRMFIIHVQWSDRQFSLSSFIYTDLNVINLVILIRLTTLDVFYPNVLKLIFLALNMCSSKKGTVLKSLESFGRKKVVL